MCVRAIFSTNVLNERSSRNWWDTKLPAARLVDNETFTTYRQMWFSESFCLRLTSFVCVNAVGSLSSTFSKNTQSVHDGRKNKQYQNTKFNYLTQPLSWLCECICVQGNTNMSISLLNGIENIVEKGFDYKPFSSCVSKWFLFLFLHSPSPFHPMFL